MVKLRFANALISFDNIQAWYFLTESQRQTLAMCAKGVTEIAARGSSVMEAVARGCQVFPRLFDSTALSNASGPSHCILSLRSLIP